MRLPQKPVKRCQPRIRLVVRPGPNPQRSRLPSRRLVCGRSAKPVNSRSIWQPLRQGESARSISSRSSRELPRQSRSSAALHSQETSRNQGARQASHTGPNPLPRTRRDRARGLLTPFTTARDQRRGKNKACPAIAGSRLKNPPWSCKIMGVGSRIPTLTGMIRKAIRIANPSQNRLLVFSG